MPHLFQFCNISIQDPTLQRTTDIVCAECANNEAVFFQVISFNTIFGWQFE